MDRRLSWSSSSSSSQRGDGHKRKTKKKHRNKEKLFHSAATEFSQADGRRVLGGIPSEDLELILKRIVWDWMSAKFDAAVADVFSKCEKKLRSFEAEVKTEQSQVLQRMECVEVAVKVLQSSLGDTMITLPPKISESRCDNTGAFLACEETPQTVRYNCRQGESVESGGHMPEKLMIPDSPHIITPSPPAPSLQASVVQGHAAVSALGPFTSRSARNVNRSPSAPNLQAPAVQGHAAVNILGSLAPKNVKLVDSPRIVIRSPSAPSLQASAVPCHAAVKKMGPFTPGPRIGAGSFTTPPNILPFHRQGRVSLTPGLPGRAVF